MKLHNLIAQIQHFFFKKKRQRLVTKVANLPHSGLLCLSFTCSLIGYFKQALKSDWLFCLSVLFSLPGKKMGFRAKNSVIQEEIALPRANQIARITSYLKMDVIKGIALFGKQDTEGFQ